VGWACPQGTAVLSTLQYLAASGQHQRLKVWGSTQLNLLWQGVGPGGDTAVCESPGPAHLQLPGSSPRALRRGCCWRVVGEVQLHHGGGSIWKRWLFNGP
jgi:hypothetical protein